VAYNRVGLTTFFEHRKVEKLYLNPLDWVRPPPHLTCQLTLNTA
jgi:nitrite reductase (NAD(P)H)